MMFGAPHIDGNGHDAVLADMSLQVATGTGADGKAIVGADADCFQGRIEIGSPRFVQSSWTDEGYVLCSATNLRLYCFGYDYNVPVL
jgi:hypothetical protein